MSVDPTPTTIMTDNLPTASPKSDPVEPREDADTAAARKELKQTAISEKTTGAPVQADRTTPDANQEQVLEQLSSPKKKRARDQVEDDQAPEEGDSKSVASSDSAKDRAARSEPEKKRHRDEGTAEAEAAESSAKPVSRSSIFVFLDFPFFFCWFLFSFFVAWLRGAGRSNPSCSSSGY